MGLRERFRPKPTISNQDVAKGLRWLTWEGTASMGFFSITTSGFLAAYALALGCDNFQIGILAAIPFLAQPLQIFVVPLVEQLRRRKVIVLASWIPAHQRTWSCQRRGPSISACWVEVQSVSLPSDSILLVFQSEMGMALVSCRSLSLQILESDMRVVVPC